MNNLFEKRPIFRFARLCSRSESRGGTLLVLDPSRYAGLVRGSFIGANGVSCACLLIGGKAERDDSTVATTNESTL